MYQLLNIKIVMKMRNCNHLFAVLIVATTVSCRQKTSTNQTEKQVADTQKTIAAKQDSSKKENNIIITSDQLVTPGKSIGKTVINESDEAVIKRLGKPDAGDAAMGKSVSIWYDKHDTAGYITQIYFTKQMGVDDTSRAKLIRVTSPWFKVKEDINVGAPVKNAMSKFRLVKIGEGNGRQGPYTLYDDAKSGIAFEADKKGTCTGVTIHEPGKKLAPNYLAFFPDLKML
jgi:hypothetical protein